MKGKRRNDISLINKRLKKKRKTFCSYTSSLRVVTVNVTGPDTPTAVSSRFSPSASHVRPLSLDTTIGTIGMDMYCRARGLKRKDFFFLLQLYVYTVIRPARFFSEAEIARFTNRSAAAAYKDIRRIVNFHWVQTTKGKQPMSILKGRIPTYQYMITTKGHNYLVEFWDYCQQIRENFSPDLYPPAPDLDNISEE